MSVICILALLNKSFPGSEIRKRNRDILKELGQYKATDALAPCIARTSAAIVLII